MSEHTKIQDPTLINPFQQAMEALAEYDYGLEYVEGVYNLTIYNPDRTDDYGMNIPVYDEQSSDLFTLIQYVYGFDKTTESKYKKAR